MVCMLIIILESFFVGVNILYFYFKVCSIFLFEYLLEVRFIRLSEFIKN